MLAYFLSARAPDAPACLNLDRSSFRGILLPDNKLGPPRDQKAIPQSGPLRRRQLKQNFHFRYLRPGAHRRWRIEAQTGSQCLPRVRIRCAMVLIVHRPGGKGLDRSAARLDGPIGGGRLLGQALMRLVEGLKCKMRALMRERPLHCSSCANL